MLNQVSYSYQENHDDDLNIVVHAHELTPTMKEWHCESLQFVAESKEEKPYDPSYHRWHGVYRYPYFNPHQWLGPGIRCSFDIRLKDDPNTHVVQYCPEWPKIAEEEISFIKALLGEFLAEIEHIGDIPVVYESFSPGSIAAYVNGKIYMSNALKRYASLPQRWLIGLHEYAHARLNVKGLSKHEKEFACDEWALKWMIWSGTFNLHELRDAIAVFGEIFKGGESDTHPSSKSRYKRLKALLKGVVS